MSALGSIGHSPSHALQRDSPLSEGAKVIVRLPYAEPAERKASPGGWCSAQRIRIYMTAGGSHASTTVVRPKPDRMRSKGTVLYQPMVIIVSFDLISQPLRAASFPSKGSLNSEVRGRLYRAKGSPV